MNEILGYITDERFDSKLKSFYFAVVEFIKWYNLCQKEK